mgnify:CR=1 FL=1
MWCVVHGRVDMTILAEVTTSTVELWCGSFCRSGSAPVILAVAASMLQQVTAAALKFTAPGGTVQVKRLRIHEHQFNI